MQCISQKTKEVSTNPGATLFTESDTRVMLNSSRSKIYPGLDTLRNMEHICHFVKHIYPNMQKISKLKAANGRRWLTKKFHRNERRSNLFILKQMWPVVRVCRKHIICITTLGSCTFRPIFTEHNSRVGFCESPPLD